MWIYIQALPNFYAAAQSGNNVNIAQLLLHIKLQACNEDYKFQLSTMKSGVCSWVNIQNYIRTVNLKSKWSINICNGRFDNSILKRFLSSVTEK
jgi:hypothetical protein